MTPTVESLYYKPDLLDALEDCRQAYRSKSKKEFEGFVDERSKLKESIKEVCL